ncbi:hypothetical protein DPMN_102371 [Dreissena polymorpha]|uniref:Uncharacterized protein n=1 Tax=Dreissena polymorpha TaxID=45954 RepID=A0A9D4LKU3_DREPO|nr:hypothetical protein DPMN_102371 [Dreissena polymorpha]
MKTAKPWRPFNNKTNLLTKFHKDWTRNVPSTALTRKTAPPTGDHVFQRTGTTFELNQNIIKKTILTNFELYRGIIGTNLLTKFHEDRTRNVASREFTWKTATPTGGHVVFFTYFELDRDLIGTKLLTKFHEDRTRNVASSVFTRFLNRQIKKTAPPTGGHIFQWTRTTFELNQDIIKTRFQDSSFELDRDLIGTKVLTKFHKDRTRNVASRVFKNKCERTDRRTKTDHKSSPEQSGDLKRIQHGRPELLYKKEVNTGVQNYHTNKSSAVRDICAPNRL